MAKSSPTAATPLRDRLESLAAFEPQEFPVLSLYLNLSADQHGRDNYETFVRKAFSERLKAFRNRSEARASVERDVERIQRYLADEVNRAANGLALFACAGAGDFFEAIQLEAPLEEHWLFVGPVPHLYPLARLVDRYPRYAAVVLDTNRARIFVFSLGGVEQRREVVSDRMRRSQVGGWSQARYQRHADNWHLLHVKDVVEVLDRVVREDQIPQIVVFGDEVVVPLLKEQLPQHLSERVVDIRAMAQETPEHEVLRVTLEMLREADSSTDAAVVEELIGQWQASGLAVAGPEAALKALALGQVDELVLAGSPSALKRVNAPAASHGSELEAETSAPAGPGDRDQLALASELVARAQQTGASIRFIEDSALLQDVGGVAARLRFRV